MTNLHQSQTNCVKIISDLSVYVGYFLYEFCEQLRRRYGKKIVFIFRYLRLGELNGDVEQQLPDAGHIWWHPGSLRLGHLCNQTKNTLAHVPPPTPAPEWVAMGVVTLIKNVRKFSVL